MQSLITKIAFFVPFLVYLKSQMLEITNHQHSEKDLFLSERLCYNLNAAQNIFIFSNSKRAFYHGRNSLGSIPNLKRFVLVTLSIWFYYVSILKFNKQQNFRNNFFHYFTGILTKRFCLFCLQFHELNFFKTKTRVS